MLHACQRNCIETHRPQCREFLGNIVRTFNRHAWSKRPITRWIGAAHSRVTCPNKQQVAIRNSREMRLEICGTQDLAVPSGDVYTQWPFENKLPQAEFTDGEAVAHEMPWRINVCSGVVAELKDEQVGDIAAI